MPCYDARDDSGYDSGFSDGKSQGKDEGYKKGYADAKARYEHPNLVKIEGEHKNDVDRLNNLLLDKHTENIRLKEELDKFKKEKDRNNRLEASLCAIINELEKKGVANEILAKASRSGLIDLMKFWAEHQKEDEARVANIFHKTFSEHEQELLKKMFLDNKEEE